MSVPSIVILTGAGISAESGVATFRDADGLWEGHRIEDVATPEGYARDPALVHEFYNLRRAALRTVSPNAAHEALARLESQWSGDFLLVTQNVDDLHERAGSRNLIHMHGELRKARCEACEKVHPWGDNMSSQSRCSRCGAAGHLRPHICWFGEIPFEMDAIQDALFRCDVFAAIGTSGVVYPAAGFAQLAAQSGARELIEINRESTAISPVFTQHRIGPATEKVTEWVEEMLKAIE